VRRIDVVDSKSILLIIVVVDIAVIVVSSLGKVNWLVGVQEHCP